MGMTIVEKILARKSGRARVRPGDIVTVDVDTAVLIDLNFWPGYYHEFRKVWDPNKIIVVFDHVVPAKDEDSARALQRGRAFAKKFNIRRLHDVGYDQGISHQLIADNAYALPGSILVCIDSHTCGAGAFNCLARGMGNPETVFVTAKGRTWYRAAPTIRYVLEGEMSQGVSAKDLFLHIAGTFGDHANLNVEYAGPGVASMSLNARRTLATMSAELSAEFAIFDADAKVVDYVRSRSDVPFELQSADPNAEYQDVRRIDLSKVEPLVAYPDSVVNNARPVGDAAGIAIDQAFVGSCANGTIDDLASAAAVVAGKKVAPHVRFIVTPGSQAVFREAVRRGIVATLSEAGALVTSSTCGACAALQLGVLADGETCITASTRNFKGRMGSPKSKIYMASPATVAASALTGFIADPRPHL
jgi:3-isopropylmalate/(R)-2-methylmalate dehydratase large subunit